DMCITAAAVLIIVLSVIKNVGLDGSRLAPDRAGQDRAGQDRAGQDRAGRRAAEEPGSAGGEG
ncbi:MAG TPA: hypothetical protein VK020_13275, partial [Microlunatus sp.]|nr:hypothetical protein [Microlunatus sp.]